jgi:NADP-dependent 3-hydroxy acid dehydrogenase YdfG
MILKGKTAIVTGASDGLGKQVALKLAQEGVSLALVARSVEKLSAVKLEAEALGSPRAMIYTCDISASKQVEDVVRQIEVDFGEIQILLNIAGIWQKMNFLEDVPIQDIDSVIDISLKGMIYMTHFVIPILKRQKEAAIINDSSKSGVTAQPGQSVYSAAKWGVKGFTDVLREDLKGTSVRVAGLYQGGTNTSLFGKVGEHLDQDKYIRPEDLADAVVFMLRQPPKIWLYDVRVEY